MVDIYYSPRLRDDLGVEFRYIILPDSHAPKSRKLMTEAEWRGMGIIMSRGWQHVGFFKNSKTLIFSRPFVPDACQSTGDRG